MAYGFNRSVTVDHTKVGAIGATDQSNFPVLISGVLSYLATTGNGGSVNNLTTLNGISVPADLIFAANSDGTSPYTWEVAAYNATTGAIQVWVNVPTLSHTTDTVFYMLYGDASVTTYQCTAANTWDSNYMLVTHLEQDPSGSAPQMIDSKGLTAGGTSFGSMASGALVNAKIDKGIKFDGTNDVIRFTNTQASIRDHTWEGWVTPNFASSSAVNQDLFVRSDGTTGDAPRIGRINYSGVGIFYTDSKAAFADQITNPLSFSAGDNFHLAMSNNGQGGGCQFFVNGVAVATTQLIYIALPANNVNFAFHMGAFETTGSGAFNGTLDEVRFSKSLRSADWINTAYNNQNSPSTFYTIGGAPPSSPSVDVNRGFFVNMGRMMR